MFKVLMISSGGLSGGISASVAGGSFWKGARQGVITSGLNHAAHGVAKFIQKASSIVAGIYGAGGTGLKGNRDLARLVTKKGGKMFKSSQPDGSSRFGNDGDDAIMNYLLKGHKAGKYIEIYGYSRGGAAAVRITNKLGAMGINVAKLVTFDAHKFISPDIIGARGGASFRLKHNNVGVAINFYQHNWYNTAPWDNPFFGGAVHSKYLSVINNDLTDVMFNNAPVNHNNIIDFSLSNYNYGL